MQIIKVLLKNSPLLALKNRKVKLKIIYMFQKRNAEK